MNLLRSLLSCARLYHWPLIILNSIAVCMILEKELLYGFTIGIQLSLLASFGFLFNDFCDLKIDEKNKVKRLWHLNRKQQKIILVASFFLVLTAFCLGYYLLPESEFVVLAIFIMLTLYNLILKKVLFIGNLIASIAIISPIWAPICIFHAFESQFLILVILSGITFNLGREIILDIKDVEGDKLVNRHTLPTLTSISISIVVSLILLLSSAFILLYAALYINDSTLFTALNITFFLSIMLYSLYPALKIDFANSQSIEIFISRSRIGMLLFPIVLIIHYIF